MAKAWSTFLPDVLPHLPDCPAMVAEHELRRAAQDFFEKSRAWSVLPDAVAVAANQDEVTLATPTGTELVRIEAAWLDSKPLMPATAQDLDEAYPSGWITMTGTPSRIVLLTPGIARLVPIPTEAATTGVTTRVSVKPAEDATGLPDDIASKYREALIKGAKARLMLYAKKPWSDATLGAALMGEFMREADAANFKANVRGHSNARRAATVVWC